MEENKNFAKKDGVTILLLVLFWPIGLIVMWVKKAFNIPTRIIITIFFILCMLIGFSSTNNSNINSEIVSTETTIFESTEETTAITTIFESTTENTTSNVAVTTEKSGEIITTNISTSNNENNITSSDNIVYIGTTGTKYHKQSCSTLKVKGKPITLDEALSQGREPCKRCKP